MYMRLSDVYLSRTIFCLQIGGSSNKCQEEIARRRRKKRIVYNCNNMQSNDFVLLIVLLHRNTEVAPQFLHNTALKIHYYLNSIQNFSI